jgi:hypothetical protein
MGSAPGFLRNMSISMAPFQRNACDGYFPFVKILDSIQAAQQCGFAASGRTDQNRQLVRMNEEIDPFQDRVAVEHLFQSLNFDQRLFHGYPQFSSGIAGRTSAKCRCWQ